MNLLIIHNRYLYRGGEDECFEAERDLLRAHGHAVSEHVLDNHSIGPANAAVAGLHAVWNRGEYRAIRSAIRQTGAEIVHVHNFFPLVSPAVYHAAAAEGVPVVQTLHNYRLLCPGALLYRDGRACEECLGEVVPWQGVRHRCYRQNLAASAAVAAMTAAHRLLGTWSHKVSAYIALTEFAREKFIAGGLPTEKLYLKPNFVPDAGQGVGNGGYALYVGRLTEEKGVRVLLEAWRKLGEQLPLKVVGAGPLETLARERTCRSIAYLGQRPPGEVYDLMRHAAALVFPSLCYENLPRTILESFAAGTPVIASRLGAMASLVRHGETGLHFRPGDAADLAAQVRWMLAHPATWATMRRHARAEYLREYTPERNYQLLMRLYNRLLERMPAASMAERSTPESLPSTGSD